MSIWLIVQSARALAQSSNYFCQQEVIDIVSVIAAGKFPDPEVL